MYKSFKHTSNIVTYIYIQQKALIGKTAMTVDKKELHSEYIYYKHCI